MLLAVDIGNSNTVLGIADQHGDWTIQWRITTPLTSVPDDWATLILPLASRDRVDLGAITAVVIGSVVPIATAGITAFVDDRVGTQPMLIRANLDLGIRLGMDNPHEVGADRIANAVAVWSRFAAATIVVDLGTATKVEAIDRSGTFLGGAIGPGLGVSLEALTSRAARLFPIELNDPGIAIGRNTVSAMQAGLVRGHAHMIRGLVSDIAAEIGEAAQVVVTGGYAPNVLRSLDAQSIHLPDLTLDGIRQIYLRNK